MSVRRAAVIAFLVSASSLGLAGDWAVVESRLSQPLPAQAHEESLTYVNAADGYRLSHPSPMTVDESLAPIRVVLAGQTASLEIYHQPLGDVPLKNYLYYGNKPILSGQDPVELLRNEEVLVNGRRVNHLWWRRPPLKRLEEDRNVYASVDIIDGPTNVYTLLFKSSSEDQLSRLVPTIVQSFETIPVSGRAEYHFARTDRRASPLSPAAGEVLRDYFSGGRQYWGIFEWSFPERPRPLLQLEERLNYTFRFVVHYSSTWSPPPTETLEAAAKEGRIVEETLQTLSLEKGYAGSITYDLLNGAYDDFLRKYARAIADFGRPVLFRLNNEMNGDWCGYSAYHASKDTSLYVAAWRYIYRLFQEEGADNALWVWNPNDVSFPDFTWNNYLLYYPGDEYVDIIGLTGYNTGNYYPGETWREFKDIYDPLYAEYTRAFPDKPLMITEFASNSVGGDKVRWMREAFAHLRDYPRIGVAVWWNGIDWDGHRPARVYRLDQTPATLEAFRQGLKRYPAYQAYPKTFD